MRTGMNQARKITPKGVPPSYGQVMRGETPLLAAAEVPVLDWPGDLFNRPGAMADDPAAYQ
ncbi:MAG: hypothetical protein EXR07_20760 [Acetobacteraceae bacterium]|nr:hypothetical protein [Acetobacteraceae bacterium]